MMHGRGHGNSSATSCRKEDGSSHFERKPSSTGVSSILRHRKRLGYSSIMSCTAAEFQRTRDQPKLVMFRRRCIGAGLLGAASFTALPRGRESAFAT